MRSSHRKISEDCFSYRIPFHQIFVLFLCDCIYQRLIAMDSLPHVINEKELLNRLQNNDVAAFTQIYNIFWKQLFYKAAQKLNNFYEAEEVVQDIFLDLWKRRSDLAISTELSTYLAVCVKYKVINLLAKRQQQFRYQHYVKNFLQISDLSTENAIRLEELKRQLLKDTTRLPEKCRMVFQLSREQGYSQKQIAIKLNIAEKTVEAHLSKALRSLRAGLTHFLAIVF